MMIDAREMLSHHLAILRTLVSEIEAVLGAVTLAEESPPEVQRDDWLSVRRAAAMFGLTTRHVRRLAEEQGLGRKNGGRWEVRYSALAQRRTETDISDLETDISDVGFPREY